MLEKLDLHLLYGNRFCGIEHTDDGDTIYVTLLRQQKNSVDVFDCFKVDKVDELPPKLKKKQHASLIINTDKVLTKKITSSSNKDMGLVFRAFPNIDLEQFYYEVLAQDSSCFVSICRKDYVDGIIEGYAENNVMVTDFFLGNLVVSSVSRFIGPDSLYTSNAIIQKKGTEIYAIDLEKAPHLEGYDVNGLTTNNGFVLSLAAALNQILKGYSPLTNSSKDKEALFSGYKQVQFLNLSLKFGLGIIFVSLLVNYFVFNHYFNGVKKLQAVSLYNNETGQKIVALKKEVDSIQKLAGDLLQMESSKSSFYINDIMQGLPNSILLSELNYQPLLKSIKDNDPIVNDLHRMFISGESSDSGVFSNWISRVEKHPWVSKVEILDYNDVSTSKSNFNIKLFLKP